jgi:transposase
LSARFCLPQQPAEWTPTAPQVRELQALVRRLDSLIEIHTGALNRLSSGGTSAAVEASIRSLLKSLEKEIKRTEQLIKKQINNHPQLTADGELLLSMPGSGAATTARLLAEINFHQYASGREVAAFAGLVRRLRQSGSSVRGRARLSKMGSPRIRHALYFPAVTAIRCHPLINAWAKGLRERGKCEMQIIEAVMRKLIHLAYGVIKSGKPYDPRYAQKA